MRGVPLPVIPGLQVLTVASGAPGLSGFIAWLEARLQGRTTVTRSPTGSTLSSASFTGRCLK